MRGRLPTPRGDARFTQPTGQDPPARPRSAARLHTNSRTTGHATPRTQQTWDGWVGPDRTRSDASLATEDTQWPTPFSHQSSAWLGKFSDSRNRLAPLCLHGGAQRGGGSAALCLPSASPLSDARCRSHETRLCAPSGWHFFTPAPTTETPSIAESAYSMYCITAMRPKADQVHDGQRWVPDPAGRRPADRALGVGGVGVGHSSVRMAPGCACGAPGISHFPR